MESGENNYGNGAKENVNFILYCLPSDVCLRTTHNAFHADVPLVPIVTELGIMQGSFEPRSTQGHNWAVRSTATFPPSFQDSLHTLHTDKQ